MPKTDRIVKPSGERADVGTARFTMRPPTLEGLDSWVNLPCWACGEPIKEGQPYYIAAVQRPLMSNAPLVHANHVE